MQTGIRGAQRPAPGNVTGMKFYQQQREQEAKRKAAAVDIAEVRRTAYLEGHSAGWDAAIAWVIETYGLDADEPGDEPQDVAQ